MSQRLGPLQIRLLHALHQHGRETSLQSLAALAAGIIPELRSRPPARVLPGLATYKAVARAVAALRRRGLINTRMIGAARGQIVWQRGPGGTTAPRWQFRNPTRRLFVKAKENAE